MGQNEPGDKRQLSWLPADLGPEESQWETRAAPMPHLLLHSDA
jgi:hypothetical protein